MKTAPDPQVSRTWITCRSLVTDIVGDGKDEVSRRNKNRSTKTGNLGQVTQQEQVTSAGNVSVSGRSSIESHRGSCLGCSFSTDRLLKSGPILRQRRKIKHPMAGPCGSIWPKHRYSMILHMFFARSVWVVALMLRDGFNPRGCSMIFCTDERSQDNTALIMGRAYSILGITRTWTELGNESGFNCITYLFCKIPSCWKINWGMTWRVHLPRNILHQHNSCRTNINIYIYISAHVSPHSRTMWIHVLPKGTYLGSVGVGVG